MSYFDNLDDEFLNKYKKYYKCVLFFYGLMLIQISLSFDSPLKTVKLKPL
jgi:hypothetical protein